MTVDFLKKKSLPSLMQLDLQFDELHTIPLRIENEIFVLKKENVYIWSKIDGQVCSGNGVIFLSNLRLVLKSESICLDLPLASTEGEKFEQPIFAANRLKGCTHPLPCSGISNKIEWSISFNDGVGTLLNLFFMYVNNLRRNENISPPTKNNIAYVDPNDTSVLLLPLNEMKTQKS